MPSEIVLTNDKHYNDIASAIRNKNGLSTLYKPSEMAEAINALVVGGTITLQDKTVNPSEETQTITHDSGYMGLGEVTVTPILTETKTVTENGNVYPTTGKYLTRVTVNVPQGGEINNQNKSVTPTESQQSVTYDDGYTGLGTVTVGAISSTYVGSGITQRSSTDLTASGATVTVPAGYYSTQASKAVSSGSATGPSSLTASSATVTTGTNTITLTKTGVTTTPTVSAGYVSSATSSTATVALTASVTTKGATTYTPTTTNQTIASGTYLTGTQTISGDADLVAGNIKQGITIFGVEGTYSGSGASLQTKSVNPTESQQEVTPDSGYDGLSKVTVGAISSTYVGSGIDRNDSTDLSASGATVTVPAGYYASSASKSVASGSATNSGTASASSATITTGTNTITLSKAVSITPTVSAGYISSGTAGNVTVSLIGSATIDPTPTASGKTVTTPAGYYTSSTTTDVDTMTLPTSASSSATTGYTSKATISRSTSDQYINIPTGYNTAGGYYKINAVANGSATGPSSLSGSSASITTGTNTITLTKTGVTTTPTVSAGYVSSATASTATVALTASVTVNPTPTVSGATVTIPSGYYSTQTTKSVSTGSATAPASISGTSATVSTGTNTLTLTKTVSVTPSVTAGYVSSGTAGNSSVSLTASVTTQGTRTITPTTSNQTIASGTYITGTQTISGDANLIAGNIKSGTSIFGVSGSYSGLDTSDATATAGDIINGLTAYADGRKLEGSLVVQKYYTGSTAPSGSLGNNGDIYFQS